MFNFEPKISFDSVVMLLGFTGSFAAQWFSVRLHVKELRKDVDDLRRGRGLILGQNSDWPDAVRRCFGFGRRAD